MGLSQYPSGLGFLSFISLVPLIPVIKALSSYKKALMIGLLWGIIYNTTSVYWLMFNIGTSNLLAFFTMLGSVIILTVSPVLILLLFCMLRKRGKSIFTLALIWPSIELIRSYGTLAFPWVSIANSLSTYNSIIQNAEYIGIYGLSSIIVLINILIFKVFENRKKINGFILFISILLPILTGKLIEFSQPKSSYGEINILSVQPNIKLFNKREYSFQNEIVEGIISQTEKSLDSDIDLIIWPETTTSTYLLQSDVKNFKKYKS